MHILAAYEMREAGYGEPQPVEPEDERAALQRDFVRATGDLQAMLARIQQLGPGPSDA